MVAWQCPSTNSGAAAAFCYALHRPVGGVTDEVCPHEAPQCGLLGVTIAKNHHPALLPALQRANRLSRKSAPTGGGTSPWPDMHLVKVSEENTMLKAVAGLSFVAISMLFGATASMAQSAGAIQMEYNELSARTAQCKAQSDRHFSRMQMLAPQGIIEQAPACIGYMEQWITRLWQLEIAYARTQGDTRHPCYIRYLRGCEHYQG